MPFHYCHLFISFMICACGQLLLAAEPPRLCLAIRGNGELMPAHWGAIAQTIETFGVPTGVAGGSSGAISSFFLESILLNPAVRAATGNQKMIYASFLVKSLQGFTSTLAEQPEWKALQEFVTSLGGNVRKPDSLEDLQAILTSTAGNLNAENSPQIYSALAKIDSTQIFSGPAIVKLKSALAAASADPSVQNKENLRLEMNQVQEALSVFGKFDAENDQALFLRDGIVNFSALANLFGRMAAFYSLKQSSAATAQSMQTFLDRCSAESIGKTWNQIIQGNTCADDLKQRIENYFGGEGKDQSRIMEKVGSGLHTIVTTSVLLEPSKSNLQATKAKYDETKTRSLGNEMGVHGEDIRFGYWGNEDDLQKIESAYRAQPATLLPKSKLFLPLGDASWSVVLATRHLATSPAEPGLSTFHLFQSGVTEAMSLGGWSDLHPIPVLKAIGCDQVVYVTRQGGDTLFGQGVANRIFHFAPGAVPATKIENDEGRPLDQTSAWSMMYNLANPRSSYAGSLAQADAVVCTNWDSFSLKTDFTKMIEEAYWSPMTIPSKHLKAQLTGLKNPTLLKVSDANARNADGDLRYAGCLPHE